MGMCTSRLVGSNGCNNLVQGWVIAYNATTLQPEGAFDNEPGQNYAAIWQKGAGLSADASGNVYGETGPSSSDRILGVSVLKLVQNGNTLSLGDYFTPYNWSYLQQNDLDLTTSVLILPDQPGPHPHLGIATGKQ